MVHDGAYRKKINAENVVSVVRYSSRLIDQSALVFAPWYDQSFFRNPLSVRITKQNVTAGKQAATLRPISMQSNQMTDGPHLRAF
jgi:hypothetical protein